ncbi:MAG: hypothetical protein EZS28_035649 [Streblomastix strix]|uniref:Uncharacterized protein n=1 Tax=Streblomastix strix TaxID=222440 RepID=A0A5J4UH11_9EUKA|nr:MAG: hypothetical protein EZS28_035649 [Streblomastix strix]
MEPKTEVIVESDSDSDILRELKKDVEAAEPHHVREQTKLYEPSVRRGDWSRKMDSGKCISLMEGLAKPGHSKSVTQTAEGLEKQFQSRYVLGRVAGEAQRGYSDGNKQLGCDSFQPILHGSEAMKQIMKDFELQGNKYSYYKQPLLDGRYQYCNTSNETDRLYNTSRFGESIQPHQIGSRTSVIHGIQVHEQSLCICRNALWLESFTTAVLQDDETNKQRIAVNGYFSDNRIYEKTRVEDSYEEMQNITTTRFRVFRLLIKTKHISREYPLDQQKIVEIKAQKKDRDDKQQNNRQNEGNCFNSRRTEFLKNTIDRCFSPHVLAEQNENKSSEKTQVQGCMEARYTDPEVPNMVARVDKNEQPKKLPTENSVSGRIDNTSWREDWIMDLEVLQLAGSSGSVDGHESASGVLSIRKCNDDQYRQYGDRMVYQKMAGEEIDAADNQKDKDVHIGERCTSDDLTYPRDKQQDCRFSQLDINGG